MRAAGGKNGVTTWYIDVHAYPGSGVPFNRQLCDLSHDHYVIRDLGLAGFFGPPWLT